MDDSLDDFFAKKDKSKKKTKTKSKLVAADLLPSSASPKESEFLDSKLEKTVVDELDELKVADEVPDGTKDKKKSKKKKEKDGKDDMRSKEDDEWNSIDEQKDYSGLRIAAKAITKENKTDDAAGDADSDTEYDENGLMKPKQNEASTVWKVNTTSVNDTDTIDSPSIVPSVIVETPSVQGGRYIPPSLRGSTPAAARTQDGNLQPINIKKKKVAPNLASREEFPTLGAGPPPVDMDTANFTKVRGGASTNQMKASAVSQQLETANMYSLLQQKQ